MPGSPHLRNSSRIPGVFLVGFMGCGKTTVGQALSERMGWRFEDLDSRITATQGRSIREIFSNHGEGSFRRIERTALLELIGEMKSHATAAALGGGTFVQAENFKTVEDSGFPAVFLDAPVAELWRRCGAEENLRPLARDENQFRQLYEARRGLYMKAAMTIETTGKTVVEIAEEVASWLQLVILKERLREV